MTISDAHQDAIKRQFGRSASDYVTSASHAGGEDLEMAQLWAREGSTGIALDVATGGGHVALAMASVFTKVVATDITQEMLDAAKSHIESKGYSNVKFQIADAESLPFANESFDCVTCRIAAHHFPNVAQFVAECFRVLRANSLFLLIDSVAPSEAECAELLNTVELLRDPTHVRTLSIEEWLTVLDRNGFMVESSSRVKKLHELDTWFDRARAPEDARARVRTALAHASERIRERLEVTFRDGTPVAFQDEKVAIKARKPLFGSV